MFDELLQVLFEQAQFLFLDCWTPHFPNLEFVHWERAQFKWLEMWLPFDIFITEYDYLLGLSFEGPNVHPHQPCFLLILDNHTVGWGRPLRRTFLQLSRYHEEAVRRAD